MSSTYIMNGVDMEFFVFTSATSNAFTELKEQKTKNDRISLCKNKLLQLQTGQLACDQDDVNNLNDFYDCYLNEVEH